MHSDQFKPKSYLKLIKKYVSSEGEQFPLMRFYSNGAALIFFLPSLKKQACSKHEQEYKITVHTAIASLRTNTSHTSIQRFAVAEKRVAAAKQLNTSSKA